MAARHTGSVIEKLEDGKVVVYVIRDDHWDEFRCEAWVDGEYCENLTYHTDNKENTEYNDNDNPVNTDNLALCGILDCNE